jgi:hypothetical protein
VNPLHDPFPADGFTVRWETWDGSATETLTLSWDNEGWTASGTVDGPGVQYVVRLSPLWQVRQFLLFRDLEAPDLWLGTDGSGRWGEMNGAHRVDLDGGIDVSLAITPFSYSMPIRRMALDVGQEASTVTLRIDVETLGVVPEAAIVRRLDPNRYGFVESEGTREVVVDRYGLATDIDGAFRRSDTA